MSTKTRKNRKTAATAEVEPVSETANEATAVTATPQDGGDPDLVSDPVVPPGNLQRTESLKMLSEVAKAVRKIADGRGYRFDIYGARYNSRVLGLSLRIDSSAKPRPKKEDEDIDLKDTEAAATSAAGPRKVSAKKSGPRSASKEEFLITVEAHYAKRPAEINRADLKEILDANLSLKWPTWLTADKTLRAGRGLFRLPWDLIAPQGDTTIDGSVAAVKE